MTTNTATIEITTATFTTIMAMIKDSETREFTFRELYYNLVSAEFSRIPNIVVVLVLSEVLVKSLLPVNVHDYGLLP